MLKTREMTWIEFDKRRKETQLVILPLGATEVYGPHLPMGADTIVAERVAELLAQRVNAVVGPTIEVGDSFFLDSFPGTLSVQPEHLRLYVEDICRSFIGLGFRRFFFLNGHLGNVAPVTQLSLALQREPGVKCAQIDWWRFVQPLGDGILQYSGPMAHGHASEAGTSILLHLVPELIGDKANWPKVMPKEDRFPDVIKYPALTELTPNGTIGDATVASAEKGKLLLDRCIDRMADFIENVFLK